MKALIVTFVSLWMGSIPLWTIENQNLYQNRVAIATDDEEEDIPLYVIKKEAANPFSLFQPTAYATLSNKIVSIDLSELSEEATVTITRAVTGEEIYSQTGMGGMEIDLSACGKGRYQIDVVSGGLWLQGEFSL